MTLPVGLDAWRPEDVGQVHRGERHRLDRVVVIGRGAVGAAGHGDRHQYRRWQKRRRGEDGRKGLRGHLSREPEREHGLRMVRRTRLDDRRRKIRMIRRIGEMLGLEAQRRSPRVDVARLSRGSCRRGNCQNRTAAPARWSRRRGSVRSAAPRRAPRGQTGAAPVQHPVVIVPAAVAQLRIVGAMRAPIAVGFRKSNGVPSTGARSPVGISVASTGVKRSASIVSTCPRMSPVPRPPG